MHKIILLTHYHMQNRRSWNWNHTQRLYISYAISAECSIIDKKKNPMDGQWFRPEPKKGIIQISQTQFH